MSRKISEKKSEVTNLQEEIEKLKEGEPIPISQLRLKKTGPSLEILIELCKRIPVGFAQQVKGVPGTTLRDRIKKLIKNELLPNEYRVTVKGKGADQRVYIIHEKEVK